ncbi:hypothetical protein GGF31_001376 [Allomyces arbusculus]|nr:hypothetical protein GGF31_001376 [Allomyces arbusculus]
MASPRNFHVFTRAQYDLMVRCLELQRNAADLPRLRELWKTVADTARGRKRWKRLQENLALVANHEKAPRYERITWMHSSLIIAPQEVRRKYETRRSRCGITPDVIDTLCHRCACYTTISDQAGQLDLAANARNP